jgi:hypothetical protein
LVPQAIVELLGSYFAIIILHVFLPGYFSDR